MYEENYLLTKHIWTTSDFDVMGWHDSHVHGLAWKGEEFKTLFLDIDYIFAWVNPVPPDHHFTFWVSPCTLVFNFVTNLDAQIGDSMTAEIEIEDITKASPIEGPKPFGTELPWTVQLQEGQICFSSTGYTQYVRERPIHIQNQKLSEEERCGFSFDCPVTIGR